MDTFESFALVLTKLDTKINSLAREEVEKQLIYWLNVNNSSARAKWGLTGG